MSDSTKTKKKLLELRELEANAAKAEIELENAKIRYAINKTDFEETHTFGPDETGVFYFSGEVTDATCYNFGRRVNLFAKRHPEAPIEIIIQTPGGSVFPGLGLYDDLRTLSEQGHKIITRVRGLAASFGVTLLQAGDERYLGAESHLMVHELSSMAWGKLHEIKNESKFYERLNRRLFDILARRSGGKWTGDALYAEVEGKDLWLDATESIEKYGLADAVG